MKRKIMIIIFLIIITFSLSSCKKEIKVYENINASDPVCKINLYTSCGDYEKHFLLLNLGHAFITLENISNDELLIGDYKLAKNEEISVSIWPISKHFSVWYNLESVMVNRTNKYTDRISISFLIDNKTVDKISSFIEKNPKWNMFYNCSFFVLDIYKIITTSDFSKKIVSPKTLADIFKKYEYQTNKSISYNDNVGYFEEGEYIKCELKLS